MLPVGLLPWRLDRIDPHNHRKLAVFDGRTGDTGSQNPVAAANTDTFPETAVLGGDDVESNVSKGADQFLIADAQRSYYSELLDVGVLIHEYRRHYLHAKAFDVDDRVAVVGSSHMEIRSVSRNEEISLLVWHSGLIRDLRRLEKRFSRDSKRLDPEEWARRPMARITLTRVAR